MHEGVVQGVLKERGGSEEERRGGVAVWGMWGKGGGEYHPLSQLWRGSGGWAAHRKQLWLHPRPHTEQLWATQSSTDRPTKWSGWAKPTGICLFFILWWWGDCSEQAVYWTFDLSCVSIHSQGMCIHKFNLCIVWRFGVTDGGGTAQWGGLGWGLGVGVITVKRKEEKWESSHTMVELH